MTRTSDPADARSTRLRLTRRGRTVNGLRDGTVEAAVGSVLRQLPRDVVATGRDLLVAVSAALEAAGGVPRLQTPSASGRRP